MAPCRSPGGPVRRAPEAVPQRSAQDSSGPDAGADGCQMQPERLHVRGLVVEGEAEAQAIPTPVGPDPALRQCVVERLGPRLAEAEEVPARRGRPARQEARGGEQALGREVGQGLLSAASLLPGGPTAPRGHFLCFREPRAEALHDALAERGVWTDWRRDRLRFGFALYHEPADVKALGQHLGAVRSSLGD